VREGAVAVGYVPTGERFLYVTVVLDAFIGRIVGSTTLDHMHTELIPRNLLQMRVFTSRVAERLLHGMNAFEHGLKPG
jgi:hypothetical protein